ncbi:hypothetical protein ACFU5B_05000 [Streptomyces murinus]|uniref:hypothetical protein n=1 Tax=Streptomyces murinus TaxID=33900 RepID=UPI00362664FB
MFWANINPYGMFRLDMNTRLDLSGVTIPGQRAAVSERAEADPPPAEQNDHSPNE